ncbi:Zinc transporter 1 [Liparis tanakae]|uniref:Zinc transporter 1 n=1 Tax=Liparis tanakae TaxID=230148 RepID=A0A4Z2FUA8_9TELE|nr:Zinc transporter 1 [Liparis tanakae]
MLGVTILLLLCEVTISQLCKSLITLVDGFHTLFILLLMAPPPPPPPQTGSIRKPPLPSLDPSTSPPHGSCSPAELPSILPAQSSIEPPAGARAQGPPRCGVSFPGGRLQPLGAFISALLLTFLCLTYFMEIISFSLEPHAARRPLLLVGVGAASLLCKLLVVRLNWDQLQKERAKASWNQSHLEETHTEETKGRAEPTHHSLHRGALVLCNPGTSSVPDTDSHPARQQPLILLRPAAQRDGELKVRSDDACVGHLGAM